MTAFSSSAASSSWPFYGQGVSCSPVLGKAFGCLSQLLLEQQRGCGHQVSEGFTDRSHKQPKSHHKPSPAPDPVRPLGTYKSHQQGGRQRKVADQRWTKSDLFVHLHGHSPGPSPASTQSAAEGAHTLGEDQQWAAEKGGEFIQQTGASVHCCLAAWHLCDSWQSMCFSVTNSPLPSLCNF